MNGALCAAQMPQTTQTGAFEQVNLTYDAVNELLSRIHRMADALTGAIPAEANQKEVPAPGSILPAMAFASIGLRGRIILAHERLDAIYAQGGLK